MTNKLIIETLTDSKKAIVFNNVKQYVELHGNKNLVFIITEQINENLRDRTDSELDEFATKLDKYFKEEYASSPSTIKLSKHQLKIVETIIFSQIAEEANEIILEPLDDWLGIQKELFDLRLAVYVGKLWAFDTAPLLHLNQCLPFPTQILEENSFLIKAPLFTTINKQASYLSKLVSKSIRFGLTRPIEDNDKKVYACTVYDGIVNTSNIIVGSVCELLEKHYGKIDDLGFVTANVMEEYKLMKIEKYFRFLKSQCLEMADVQPFADSDFDRYHQTCLKKFTKA